MRIRARSCAISDAKVYGREKIPNFSDRKSLRIACNLSRRTSAWLRILYGDLCGSWRGCTSSGGANLGAISRDFGREILRPRKFFEIFGPKIVANRIYYLAPHLSMARNTVWGPLRVLARLHVVGRCGFGRDFGREILRPRKFSKFFGLKIVANRMQALVTHLSMA